MTGLSAEHWIVIGTFVAVILVIAVNAMDMTVAALAGVGVLTATGNVQTDDVLKAVGNGGGSLALLFGGMVAARMLVPTGIFDLTGRAFLRFTGGSGRRLLLGLFLLVAPVCAVLPNATTVILLAPVIIRVCAALGIDFTAPLILTAIISNSAGMLTLVGDPATFLIARGVGYNFATYMRQVAPGGLLALLVIIPVLPIVVPAIWRLRVQLPVEGAHAGLQRPAFFTAAVCIVLAMVVLFVVGEELPQRLLPPEVSMIGAGLALLLLQYTQKEPVSAVIADVDWKTLLFLACIFTMVEVLARTGVFSALSEQLFSLFGTHVIFAGLAMLAGVGLLSGFLANIPVAVAMLAVLKGYFVVAQLVPEEALSSTYGAWPAHAVPAFIAMMFGATLGGNATMIGASANMVAVGISAANGKPVTFATFLRYGVPITVAQLATGAAYFLLLDALAP